MASSPIVANLATKPPTSLKADYYINKSRLRDLWLMIRSALETAIIPEGRSLKEICNYILCYNEHNAASLVAKYVSFAVRRGTLRCVKGRDGELRYQLWETAEEDEDSFPHDRRCCEGCDRRSGFARRPSACKPEPASVKSQKVKPNLELVDESGTKLVNSLDQPAGKAKTGKGKHKSPNGVNRTLARTVLDNNTAKAAARKLPAAKLASRTSPMKPTSAKSRTAKSLTATATKAPIVKLAAKSCTTQSSLARSSTAKPTSAKSRNLKPHSSKPRTPNRPVNKQISPTFHITRPHTTKRPTNKSTKPQTAKSRTPNHLSTSSRATKNHTSKPSSAKRPVSKQNTSKAASVNAVVERRVETARSVKKVPILMSCYDLRHLERSEITKNKLQASTPYTFSQSDILQTISELMVKYKRPGPSMISD